MSAINHQFRLAARPVGLPKRSDFNYTEEPVRDPGPGQILVKILYVSLDPAMRGWMNEGKSYVPPVGIGEVMRAGAVGRVIASQNPGFAVGDHVVGMFGMQEYALSDGKGITKVDPKLAPLPVYLGTLGMPGLDRILRAAGSWRTQSRRHGGGFRRGRRGRNARGPDCQDQRRASRGSCRQPGKM